ncbi:MAG: isoprenoid biosynthesis protein ElbB [Myxococcales bacterium]|nr:isoprenoid biosynthesis protein ElbB [Myxococcales bacterium]
MKSKNVGVILAGCGWLDGAEIQEAVCTLLALDQRGAETIVMAPDKEQMHVVDHLAEAPADGQTRNVMIESARIARGAIVDIATVDAGELDALVIPGGFGAAKNLCNFATEGPDMSVDEDVANLIRAIHSSGKPLGFICIAPAIAAKILGPDHSVEVTIGSDQGTADAIRAMGAQHIDTNPGEIHIDEANNVVSTPAYMVGPSIAKVHAGIDRLIATVLDRC